MKYILTIAFMLAFFISMAQAGEVIKGYSGNGMLETEAITVPDNWVVEWDYKGPYMQILVSSEDDIPLGYAGQQTGSGSGSQVQPEGGTYKLTINGVGDWKVKILKSK